MFLYFYSRKLLFSKNSWADCFHGVDCIFHLRSRRSGPIGSFWLSYASYWLLIVSWRILILAVLCNHHFVSCAKLKASINKNNIIINKQITLLMPGCSLTCEPRILPSQVCTFGMNSKCCVVSVAARMPIVKTTWTISGQSLRSFKLNSFLLVWIDWKANMQN